MFTLDGFIRSPLVLLRIGQARTCEHKAGMEVTITIAGHEPIAAFTCARCGTKHSSEATLAADKAKHADMDEYIRKPIRGLEQVKASKEKACATADCTRVAVIKGKCQLCYQRAYVSARRERK